MPRGKRNNPKNPIDRGAPPSVIAERFGGLQAFANAIETNKSTVHRWLVRGLIHPRHHQAILEAAAREKVKVKPADFVDTRPADQRGVQASANA